MKAAAVNFRKIYGISPTADVKLPLFFSLHDGNGIVHS